jgi:geranylgeranyl pyrophosphate synthase
MTDRPVPLEAYLGQLRVIIEDALPRSLPQDAPAMVLEAMRYALLGGGKRLRPCLTLAAAEAAALKGGVPGHAARWLALPCACAVELVHTYSLVHDDLPAMDDDTMRRGRPTTHVIYGDGLAILAGDGLLTEAFAVLSHPSPRLASAGAIAMSPDARLRAIRALALAAGAVGMVGGQAIDLAAAGAVPTAPADRPVDRAALEDMHARKTGALIRASAVLGAIATDADETTVAAIDGYARELGLAFQIVDDILDVEGSKEELGKTAGKDAAAGKPTYPSLVGVEASRRLASECVARARDILAAAGLEGRLSEIAEWSLTRRH